MAFVTRTVPKTIITINRGALVATGNGNCVLSDQGLTDVMIVASHAHRFYVQEQVDELSLSSEIVVTILLEPLGRNTAPAIALAALASEADEVLWVMPADHVLEIDDLSQRLATAQQLAMQQYLVTFGIMPKHPETGYGYIEQGPGLDGIQEGV